MGNMKYYIAYGSNMSTRQMAFRCPDAKLVGTGYLKNHRLAFYLHATVERVSSSNESTVPVAVWQISAQDEKNLDRYEGVPSYYSKRMRTVTMGDGSQIKGLIYLMEMKRDAQVQPHYFNGILNAYKELGFTPEIETVLLPALMKSRDRFAHQKI